MRYIIISWIAFLLFFNFANAEVFPTEAKTITGYLNGGCYVNSEDDVAPQNGNGECFHGNNSDMNEVTIPDDVLPNMPVTILATKLWFIQNGGVPASTGYASIGCEAQATTFLNFIDAVINYHVSDTALVQFYCPAGSYLYIQNTEPDNGALMQYEITYLQGNIASSSTTTIASLNEVRNGQVVQIGIILVLAFLFGVDFIRRTMPKAR